MQHIRGLKYYIYVVNGEGVVSAERFICQKLAAISVATK